MHLKRDQDLHRRKVEVVYKEAELQKLHNFLPISLYRAIRDPVKKLLGLPAHSTVPIIKPQEREIRQSAGDRVEWYTNPQLFGTGTRTTR